MRLKPRYLNLNAGSPVDDRTLFLGEIKDYECKFIRAGSAFYIAPVIEGVLVLHNLIANNYRLVADQVDDAGWIRYSGGKFLLYGHSSGLEKGHVREARDRSKEVLARIAKLDEDSIDVEYVV